MRKTSFLMLRLLHTHTEALIYKKCTQESEKSGLCREMLTLGTKIPQLKMFKLEDKRGACREKEGGREEGREGKRNGGK